MRNEIKSVKNSLTKFKDKANHNDKIKKMIDDWEVNILIEDAEDESNKFTITVFNSVISEVQTGHISNHIPQIILRAASITLIDLFDGELNPAQLVADGELEVFGSVKDQIKLDAVALVLWEN